ncbi:ATP-binding protein [Thermodesulfobacteriota bacterium]
MKEIVIISGKGGTGKTTLTAAFGYLARNNVMADCDVDAADLHILAHPRPKHEEAFKGGFKASIDPRKCIKCGLCAEHCRFDAITARTLVDPLSCEGCGLCYHLCPEDAVTMESQVSGRWFISETRFGPMVHAALYPGEENSGKLVALVRNQARVLARRSDKEVIICDGAPGVGCPVISSVTGADHVLVVTEPSLSGLHDMRRAIYLVKEFGIGISVVINKWDVNRDVAAAIEAFCTDSRVPVIGRIPYDPNIIRAMVARRTAVENGQTALGRTLRDIWGTIQLECLS